MKRCGNTGDCKRDNYVCRSAEQVNEAYAETLVADAQGEDAGPLQVVGIERLAEVLDGDKSASSASSNSTTALATNARARAQPPPRLGRALITALSVVTLVFVLIRAVPGDPVDAILGDQASSEDRAAVRASLHLDEPVLQQYGRFIREVLTGRSVTRSACRAHLSALVGEAFRRRSGSPRRRSGGVARGAAARRALRGAAWDGVRSRSHYPLVAGACAAHHLARAPARVGVRREAPCLAVAGR